MAEFKKNVFWTCQRILLYHNQKGIRGAINWTIFVFLCFYCTWFWVFSFTFANRRAYDPSVVSFCVQIIKWHSIKIYQEKKMILWLGVQYLHWRKQEREFEAFDIGTKAKLMFANSTFFPVEKQTKFRKNCLKFYKANFLLIFRLSNMHSFCIPESVSFLVLQVLYLILQYRLVLFIKLASKMFFLLNHQ